MSEEVTPAGRPDPVFSAPEPAFRPTPVFRTSTPPKPGPPRRRNPRDTMPPEDFAALAKRVVVENYNRHRDTERSPEMPDDGVTIKSCSKVLGNWNAMVVSHIVKGLIWEVTYNVYKREIYLDVYKKLNNVRIDIPDLQEENS